MRTWRCTATTASTWTPTTSTRGPSFAHAGAAPSPLLWHPLLPLPHEDPVRVILRALISTLNPEVATAQTRPRHVLAASIGPRALPPTWVPASLHIETHSPTTLPHVRPPRRHRSTPATRCSCRLAGYPAPSRPSPRPPPAGRSKADRLPQSCRCYDHAQALPTDASWTQFTCGYGR